MSDFEPRTRNEALLNAIAENTSGGDGTIDITPVTRNEYLLKQIMENTEGGGSGLPDVTDADDGKVLGVENGAWGKMDAPGGLPNVTQSDNEKILIVDNGTWQTEYAAEDVSTHIMRPVTSKAVASAIEDIGTTINNVVDKLEPAVYPCDATAYAVMQSMMESPHAPINPDYITLAALPDFMLLGYLVWSNGTKCDSGKFLLEMDLTNNAITMYARGKSSIISGEFGVGAWTVTPL